MLLSPPQLPISVEAARRRRSSSAQRVAVAEEAPSHTDLQHFPAPLPRKPVGGVRRQLQQRRSQDAHAERLAKQSALALSQSELARAVTSLVGATAPNGSKKAQVEVRRAPRAAPPPGVATAALTPSRAQCASNNAELWAAVRAEAQVEAREEPFLASFLYSSILCHSSLCHCLSSVLANKLGCATLPATQLYQIFLAEFCADESLGAALAADLRAVLDRDPACASYVQCILFFKGFQALQTHRLGHALWLAGRKPLAAALQSRVSEAFHVDIHPGARIGPGLMLDHATGVVIGETAVIGSNCSFLHQVTLGGSGTGHGSRHPQLGDGVLIGAGVSLLGAVRIGSRSKIGAGSVVLQDVGEGCTAVGVPARVLACRLPGGPDPDPALSMDQVSSILCVPSGPESRAPQLTDKNRRASDWMYVI